MKNSVLPDARSAGVCLHITSLPGNWGIGEIGPAAREFVDTMARTGLRVWQYLPLGPTGYGDSPYQSLSTFAGNELLLSIDDLLSAQLLKPEEVQSLAGLPSAHTDFGTLIPIKNAVLSTVAIEFHQRASQKLLSEFEDFVALHDKNWLHDYALFRVLKSMHDFRPWPEWPEPFAMHNLSALAELEESASESINAIKVLQFLFYSQWQVLRSYANERGVQLFGDVPIYIALDSADAWSHPEILRIDRRGQPDRVAGVPPDYFSADGQLWGNPLYDWDFLKANDYHWWIERLRSALHFSDMVRIDHFRGFESFWSVPAEASTARDGVWEPGPGDDFFNAVKSALGHLPLVAEDLGVITDEVNDLRDRHDLPGMEVLQFRIAEEKFTLDQIREHCVCYTGTHDNDTTKGWFFGSPDDLRSAQEIQLTQQAALAITKGTAETISMNMIRLLFSTPARLCIAPMQDYLNLGSDARMNTPGTSSGNWRWRMHKTQLDDTMCEMIKENICSADRN